MNAQHQHVEQHENEVGARGELRRLREHLELDAAVIDAAAAATAGTWLDPFDLIDWLIAQADGAWLKPPAVRRWAQIIVKEGRLPGCG